MIVSSDCILIILLISLHKCSSQLLSSHFPPVISLHVIFVFILYCNFTLIKTEVFVKFGF